MDTDAEEQPTGRDPAEIELLVPEDGEQLLAELRRHGITPGQRVRVRTPATPPAAVRTGEGGLPSLGSTVNVDTALAVEIRRKRPPFVSPAGALRGRLPDLTWIDFETASGAAIADTESG